MSWKTIASTIGLAGVCCLVSVPSAIAQGPAPGGKGQGAPGAPGGPGGPGGMPQMTPEMQAKIKAWQKWNEAHKPLGDLQTLFRKVEQLDKEPGAELTKPQATKMLAILKPWSTKTTMTNDQANGVMKSITGLLTPTQVTKLATMQGGRRGGGGMGGGMGGGGGRRAGGGPGGPGGPGGAVAGGPRPGGPAPGGPGAPGGRAPGTAGPGGPGAGRPGGGGGGGRMGGGGGGMFKMPDPPKNAYNPLNPATLPFEQMRPRAKKNMDEFLAALQAKK